MSKPWIALFSQSGKEIADLSEKLGRKPDLIITNKDTLSCMNGGVDKRIDEMYHLPRKPEAEHYENILQNFDRPIITLHGYLRIIPPEICEKYTIFNGHPGLITEYPELKGKDPQVRAHEGNYVQAGCVLHRVTAGVDEGPIIAEERFNRAGLSLEGLFHILRDRSLYLWINFLKNNLW